MDQWQAPSETKQRIETAMRTFAIVLFGVSLLSLTGAHATTTPSDIANLVPVIKMQTGLIQLAGSFQNSTAKLADKYLSGASGGFYGIGGSEPHAKYFKNRMRKVTRCCANSR